MRLAGYGTGGIGKQLVTDAVGRGADEQPIGLGEPRDESVVGLRGKGTEDRNLLVQCIEPEPEETGAVGIGGLGRWYLASLHLFEHAAHA